MVPKVAYVTSAAKGLGHTTVKALLLAGWDVLFTYGKSVEEADRLVSFAKSHGRRAVAVQTNLLDKSDVLASVRHCQREFGRIDAFIHNFGPFIFERNTLSDYTDDMWNHMMDGNLTNFVWIYREVVTGMRQRAFGRIITIGYDGAGDAVGWRFRAAYAAAKAGLAALTRSIAKEERQNGITANMVCPGDIRGVHKMEMIGEVEDSVNPLGRPPVGEDVGRLVAYLCHEHSQQMSGTVTSVTGGYDILAYDDGKQVVTEPREFAVGDRVWVHPWQMHAVVREVSAVPNRYKVYQVENGEMQSGHFTAFQLAQEGEVDAFCRWQGVFPWRTQIM